MTKLAYIFPGQGSQSVGMMKDLYESNDASREIFEKADNSLGFSLSKIIFEGPEEELKKTANTQPAILTASIARFVSLDNKDPDVVAGHSVGEYSALVAAKALKFEDAVKLVYLRGKFMEEAVPNGTGTMAAIIGLSDEKVEELISAYGEDVQVANFNCPGQVVISGKTAAVNVACEKIKEAGAKRALILPVSGPFHSSSMKPAADKLKEELDKTEIKDPEIAVIANVTADNVKTAAVVKDLLVKQVYSSVLWTRSIKKMISDGIEEFIEVGPGNVLTGLVNKVKKELVAS